MGSIEVRCQTITWWDIADRMREKSETASVHVELNNKNMTLFKAFEELCHNEALITF